MCRRGLIVLLPLLLPAILAINFEDTDTPPMVETAFGPIIGKWTKSSKGINVATFLGIPYAEPPINNLRFRKPKAWNSPWNLLEAKSDGQPCIQIVKLNTTIGSEDCLYLNVFVPVNRADVKLSKQPVLVYIHGGAFTKGSGNSKLFTATHWADQEVILVMINYRLGPLGFYSLGNSIAPGNYGIKDMVMALEWVQKNIESFGGDRNSVTLMGASSGAASAHILALSKKTEGLFDKLILHSGTALAGWAVHPKHKMREVSETIASYLNCPNTLDVANLLNTNETMNDNNDVNKEYSFRDSDDMLYKRDLETIQCMRSFDAESILMALSYLYSQHEHPYCIFGPTIESESSDAIITMFPMEIVEKKLFRDIPSIMGIVRDEGLLKTYDFYMNSEKLNKFMNQFDTILPAFLEIPDVINNVDDFANAIKDFYFGQNFTTTRLWRLTDMTGDGLFHWSVYKTVDYLSKLMKSNIYFFCFDYLGTFSIVPEFGFSMPIGVSHSDDIKYFFSSTTSITKSDKIVIHVLTELWSNFIKTGVPSTWSAPNWPAYRDHHEFMLFKGNQEINITIEDDFLTERMVFWDNLMYNYSDELTKWYLASEKMNEINKQSRGVDLEMTKYVPLLTVIAIIAISI